MNLEFKMDLS